MARPRKFGIAVVMAVALVAWAAPVAGASRTQTSVFQDDKLLLQSGDQVRDKTLDMLQSLGVDTIHTLVMWSRYAPKPREGIRPVFDATDPAAYGNWGPLDALVAGAQARGMHVLMSPSGRSPAWGTQCKGSIPYRQRCAPKPREFGAFVRALGTRYPTVTQWSFWNEPNHSAWLVPQTGKRNGVRVNLAAMAYRQIVQAGIAGLRAAGHDDDLVLMGETAPVGTGHSTGPVDFYRELFCLDRGFHRFRGRAARARGCPPHLRYAISGISHHPYTFGGFGNPRKTGRPADAPIGALGRLTHVLDRAARLGIVQRQLPIYLTELGFQSRPPDPFGVSLAAQARYLNESDYIAFNNPRVKSVAQYTLRDDPKVAGFNTGLVFASGRAKPALAAYALPIWIAAPYRKRGIVWGQVRPARGPVSVEIEHRTNARKRFTTFAIPETNRAGYFLIRVPSTRGQWRLRYGSRYSRVAVTGG